MTARIVHHTILVLTLASLPCFVTAAGSPGSDNATANAPATGADQTSLYDYAFYAPGSYSSWFYVSPPAFETTLSAPEARKQSSAPVAMNVPVYYDFEPRWGPLFG